MNWDGEEARKFPRAVFPCKIRIYNSLKESVSYTENISEQGVKIVLDIKLEIFSIVRIEIFIKKSNPIFCQGKVAWIEDEVNPVGQGEILYHTGITFISISDEDRACIRGYINHLLSSENKPGQKDEWNTYFS